MRVQPFLNNKKILVSPYDKDSLYPWRNPPKSYLPKLRKIPISLNKELFSNVLLKNRNYQHGSTIKILKKLKQEQKSMKQEQDFSQKKKSTKMYKRVDIVPHKGDPFL